MNIERLFWGSRSALYNMPQEGMERIPSKSGLEVVGLLGELNLLRVEGVEQMQIKQHEQNCALTR